MNELYINASEVNENSLRVDLDSLLILNVDKICDSDNIKLKILLKPEAANEIHFNVYLDKNCYEVVTESNISELAVYCKWPALVIENTVIAGLCSVARQLIKSSANEDVKHLLGFREACLMSCNERSIWTRFCEIDMIKTVQEVIAEFDSYKAANDIFLPENLTRFENHMQQPVRIHNVYKLARKVNNDKTIKSSAPLKDLNVEHCYSEGPFITLADMLLYPCFYLLINIFGSDVISSNLPLTYAWFERTQKTAHFLQVDCRAKGNFSDKNIIQYEVKRQSLYTTDPNRYNPQNRIYTKQNDIDRAIGIIKASLKIKNNYFLDCKDDVRNWDELTLLANPETNATSKKRSESKRKQIENLAKAVLSLVNGTKLKIVDFCSGSGYLGILLAKLLPNCDVILVENKERSLVRAKQRCIDLQLTNVTFVQSNLDFFQASFDVGVSLHACGVATDLVLEACIKNNAHFVSCPCCYGSVYNCHHLSYPRSKHFTSAINYNDYLHLAHAADQTHDNDNPKTNQGYLCMDIIDYDRKLFAEMYGYDVCLAKLQPVTCTLKNNLLVGRFINSKR